MNNSDPGAPSSRIFSLRPVPRDDLETMLEVAYTTGASLFSPVWTHHSLLTPPTTCLSELHGAPAALICTSGKRLRKSEWLSYGMFLRSIQLAAESLGLMAYPIADQDKSKAVFRNCIGIPRETVIVGVVAIGYADPAWSAEVEHAARHDVLIRFLS